MLTPRAPITKIRMNAKCSDLCWESVTGKDLVARLLEGDPGSQLIPADSTKPITVVNPKDGKKFTLEELQGFVGGYIERIPVKGGFMYLNEEGKLKDLPRNERATQLALDSQGIFPDDYICGDALVVLRSKPASRP